MSASVVDSTIDISYTLDNTPCLACGCMGNGKWAGLKYKPLKQGKYYVYQIRSPYCAPGALCQEYRIAPIFLGTLTIINPTGIVSPDKGVKNTDVFKYTVNGSSVTVNLVKNSRVILKAYGANGVLLGELFNGTLSTGFHNINIVTLDRMVPAKCMVILNMTVNSVTKALKRVTDAKSSNNC